MEKLVGNIDKLDLKERPNMLNVAEHWVKRLWEGALLKYCINPTLSIPVQIDLGLNWIENKDGKLHASYTLQRDLLINYLQPIPLTKTIIEKTGFTKIDDNKYNLGQYQIQITIDEDYCHYYNQTTQSTFKYFHELQYLIGTDLFYEEFDWCELDFLFPKRMWLLVNKEGKFIIV